MAERASDPVSTKTSEEALDFVRKLQSAFPNRPRTKQERAALQKYLAQFAEAELRAIGRRVLSDLMQRPPRTIKEGDLPPVPVAPSDPHAAAPAVRRPKAAIRGKQRARGRRRPTGKRTAAKRPTSRRRGRRS